MARHTSARKLAQTVIVALAIGTAVGLVHVPAGLARSNDANLLVADNITPGGATSTMTPTKHRYWRHRGGKHPHFGSRRVRTPQSSASPNGGR